MNFLKRAVLSIKRKPGKTVILLLLVFILGNIISGAISIQQAVQNTENNLRRNLPAVATLEIDWDAMTAHERITGEWPDTNRLNPEVIREVGELSYVKNFDFSITSQAYSQKLERYWYSESGEEDWMGLGVKGLEQFNLRGVNNPEILDIQEGVIELVAGRTFTEQEMTSFNKVSSLALVSQDFAELNNLTVGSTFTLDNTLYDMYSDDSIWDGSMSDIYAEDNIIVSESYEFEVIGIFNPIVSPNTGQDHSDEWQLNELKNTIYIPNIVAEGATTFLMENLIDLLNELGTFEEEGMEAWTLKDVISYENIIYVLNDPTDLQDFAEAATPIIPEFWKVNDLSSTFSDISSSMENMQWLASVVLWVAVVATLLILSLLITLFLRDRKYEMGIYLALGEKKIKVVTQIILEVVAVAIVAITLSLFTGSLLASNISERMLKEDLIAGQESNMEWGWSSGDSLSWFSNGDMTIDEMVESYDLSLNATTVVMFYGIGIGAILISTIVPIMYIIRLNPKKIMM